MPLREAQSLSWDQARVVGKGEWLSLHLQHGGLSSTRSAQQGGQALPRAFSLTAEKGTRELGKCSEASLPSLLLPLGGAMPVCLFVDGLASENQQQSQWQNNQRGWSKDRRISTPVKEMSPAAPF